MAERKSVQKYHPPDFDPELITRYRRGDFGSPWPEDEITVRPKRQHKVRIMAPFSMRCTSCGEYIYKGKKFNARKEVAMGEMYFAIRIFRFYIRCQVCLQEIVFKTDPQNTDYFIEHGAQRNFEPWRDEQMNEEQKKVNRELEEENNPMKALENKAQDSKREMDVLDQLHEIRTRNTRHEEVGAEGALNLLEREEALRRAIEEEEIAEEDIKVKQVFEKTTIKRLPDVESDAVFKKPKVVRWKNSDVHPKTSNLETIGIIAKKRQENQNSSIAAPSDSKITGISLVSTYSDSE